MSGHPTKLSVLLLLLLLFSSIDCLGQIKPIEEDEALVKIKTAVVSLPVFVSDAQGRSVGGLTKDNFSIFLNSVPQRIDLFANVDEPITVAIIIDTSGSVAPFWDDIKRAAKHVANSLYPQDRAMVMSFDQRPRVRAELTADLSEVKRTISSAEISILESEYKGQLNEALVSVLTDHFASIKGRKAIVILTDGAEVADSSKESLLAALRAADTAIYPVYFYGDYVEALIKRVKKGELAGRTEENKDAPVDERIVVPNLVYLDTIAKMSGGRILSARAKNIRESLQQITEELRKQYLIGFHVEDDSPMNLSNISVTVNRPNMIIRTKQGVQLNRPATTPDIK